MAKLGGVVKTYVVTKRSDISAILSAKMVGEKVIILKFSVESSDHDIDHDHDPFYSLFLIAILLVDVLSDHGS